MSKLRSVLGAAVVLALILTSYRVALADAHEEEPAESTAEVSQTMTLPSGKILVFVPVEVNLSKSAVAKPVSVAPDIWYGVSDKLSLGVAHSSVGLFGAFGGAGDGICFTGKSRNCDKVYQQVGLFGRFSVAQGNFSLALSGGAFTKAFDPFTLTSNAGLIGQLNAGPLAILFAPNISVGLTERSGGNKEDLSIPVAFVFAAGDKLSFGIQSGIVSPLEDLADNFVVPLTAGLRFAATDMLSVDAAFTFVQITGGKLIRDAGADGFDARVATVGATFVL